MALLGEVFLLGEGFAEPLERVEGDEDLRSVGKGHAGMTVVKVPCLRFVA